MPNVLCEMIIILLLFYLEVRYNVSTFISCKWYYFSFYDFYKWKITEKYDAFTAAAIIHVVGSLFTLLIYTLKKDKKHLWKHKPKWIYLGGVIGVIVVMLFNIIVPKVPALKLTLLVFVGQVFAGIILDAIIGKNYSDKSFFGGIVIALGIAINMIIEWIIATKKQKHQYIK